MGEESVRVEIHCCDSAQCSMCAAVSQRHTVLMNCLGRLTINKDHDLTGGDCVWSTFSPPLLV